MTAAQPPAAGVHGVPAEAASANALVRLHGPAAPLLRADIDTDTIAPLVRGIAGPQPAGAAPRNLRSACSAPGATTPRAARTRTSC